MKKSTLIIIVALAVAGLWYFFKKQKTGSGTDPNGVSDVTGSIFPNTLGQNNLPNPVIANPNMTIPVTFLGRYTGGIINIGPGQSLAEGDRIEGVLNANGNTVTVIKILAMPTYETGSIIIKAAEVSTS